MAGGHEHEEGGHGGHALFQWPATTAARLNYVAGFPFALLFHATVPNCATDRWRTL